MKEIDEYIQLKTELIQKIESTDKHLNTVKISLKGMKQIDQFDQFDLKIKSKSNSSEQKHNHPNTNIKKNVRSNSESITNKTNDQSCKNLYEITVNKEKYNNLIKELKELKTIKNELTSKLNLNQNSYKKLEISKNKEIQQLNISLSETEKKIYNIENNL